MQHVDSMFKDIVTVISGISPLFDQLKKEMENIRQLGKNNIENISRLDAEINIVQES